MTDTPKKDTIEMPLPEFVKQIALFTIQESVPKIIEEHQKNCPIASEAKMISTEVRLIQNGINKKGGFVERIITSVLSSLVTAFIFWLMFIYKTN